MTPDAKTTPIQQEVEELMKLMWDLFNHCMNCQHVNDETEMETFTLLSGRVDVAEQDFRTRLTTLLTRLRAAEAVAAAAKEHADNDGEVTIRLRDALAALEKNNG